MDLGGNDSCSGTAYNAHSRVQHALERPVIWWASCLNESKDQARVRILLEVLRDSERVERGREWSREIPHVCIYLRIGQLDKVLRELLLITCVVVV